MLTRSGLLRLVAIALLAGLSAHSLRDTSAPDLRKRHR